MHTQTSAPLTHYVVAQNQNYRICAIPAFNDNYLWLIDDGLSAFVVDPGDAEPVLKVLKALKLTLTGILLTHHHADHTGGIQQLQKEQSTPIYGPASKDIPLVTHPLSDGQPLEILGMQTSCIEVPGHTLDHIAYFLKQPNPLEQALLFCGDTLFAGGCGRVFEGSFAQMHASLNKLKSLPQDTLIFCAHEYTQANLQFAQAVEPENDLLTRRINSVAQQREKNLPSVPSTLESELTTNPFLRCDQPAVIHAAQQRAKQNTLSTDQVFAQIRGWKDNF